MYILNIASAINKISVNEIRDFTFEKYYKRIEFSKESSYHSMKHQKEKRLQLFATKLKEKMPDSRNAKEHYQSFIYMKRKTQIQ